MFSDPFTETKKSTVARGNKWEEVGKILNQIARELRSKLKQEKKASGIETDIRSIEVAPEELTVLFPYSCILISLLQIMIKK